MPVTCDDIASWSDYRGADPAPADFGAFWEARMAEADAVDLEWRVEATSEVPWSPGCACYDLWFRGTRGEKVYAKYLRPRDADGPVPLVLQFHGYPGASRSWFEQASFVGMGCAVIAMDNPGQGGRSEDVGGYAGTTVAGHLVAGADGDPKDLYYVRLYQDVRVLCRVVRAMGEEGAFDLSRVFVNGASQGGGMGVACCALNPDLISRAAILYPFLSDFPLVSRMGADEVAYEGLRYWSRWYDPDGEHADELFGKLAYFDTKNFAPWVRCPVIFGTGLADEICPPKTQCAVYNGLATPKRRFLYGGLGHEEIQQFDDLIIGFFGQVIDGAGEAGPFAWLRPRFAGGEEDPDLLDGSAWASSLGEPSWATYSYGNARMPDGTSMVLGSVIPKGGGQRPVLLYFHDAGRRGRGWFHLMRYLGFGWAVAQLETSHAAPLETLGVSEDPGDRREGRGSGMAPPAHGSRDEPGGLAWWAPERGQDPRPAKRPAKPDLLGRLSRLRARATRGRDHPPSAPSDLSAIAPTVKEALLAYHTVRTHSGERATEGAPWARVDPERVAVYGEGFGGAVALYVAALEEPLCAAAFNPFPAAPLTEGAARTRCPVLLGTCLLDEVADPGEQDGLAAALPRVRRKTYPKYAHERVNAFENELFAFLAAGGDTE